jgi:hypothetical protein
MDLATAKALTLMGRPESWDAHGGQPMEKCPDKALRAARGFFTKLLNEGTQSRRMEQQVEAINQVLADREANHPQQKLAL